MNTIKMPSGLAYWTADEVAECLSYRGHLPVEYEWKKLYEKLWSFLEAADNATPLGGDGSNGTVEEPSGRLDLDNDDKAGHWWNKLTAVEADAIAKAYIDQRKWGSEEWI